MPGRGLQRPGRSPARMLAGRRIRVGSPPDHRLSAQRRRCLRIGGDRARCLPAVHRGRALRSRATRRTSRRRDRAARVGRRSGRGVPGLRRAAGTAGSAPRRLGRLSHLRQDTGDGVHRAWTGSRSLRSQVGGERRERRPGAGAAPSDRKWPPKMHGARSRLRVAFRGPWTSAPTSGAREEKDRSHVSRVPGAAPRSAERQTVGPRARDRAGCSEPAAQHRLAGARPPGGRHARRPPRQGRDGRLGDRDGRRRLACGGGCRHRLRRGRSQDLAHRLRPARRPFGAALGDRGRHSGRLQGAQERGQDPPPRRHRRATVSCTLGGREESARRRLPRHGPSAEGGRHARRRQSLHRGVPGRRRRGVADAALGFAEHRQGTRRAAHRDGEGAGAQPRSARSGPRLLRATSR